MIPKRMMFLVFVIAALAYVGLERATFTVPLSLEAAEACGFTINDFAPSGKIEYAPTQAWWLSFMRKQEYFGAITVGLAAAFVAFALSAVRQLGAGIASGAAVGFSRSKYRTLPPGMHGTGVIDHRYRYRRRSAR